MDQATDSPSRFVLQQLLFGMELRLEKPDRFDLKLVTSLERISSRHHTTLQEAKNRWTDLQMASNQKPHC